MVFCYDRGEFFLRVLVRILSFGFLDVADVVVSGIRFSGSGWDHLVEDIEDSASVTQQVFNRNVFLVRDGIALIIGEVGGICSRNWVTDTVFNVEFPFLVEEHDCCSGEGLGDAGDAIVGIFSIGVPTKS